ncbi:MAG: amidophosphoribosyltransferase [Candidatus Aenigmatarchaeota archaeon]
MCGIAGVYTPGKSVVVKLAKIMKKEWTRGHTSFGIETYDEKGNLYIRKGMRTPGDEDLEGLKGDIGIGHQRYSTRGSNKKYFLKRNSQPMSLHIFPIKGGGFVAERCDYVYEDELEVKSMMSIAHNGDIFNTEERRDYHYQCDIKYFAWPFADELAKDYDGTISKEKLTKVARKVIPQLKGSFSFVGYTVDRNRNKTMFAGRDPWGIKPGFIGEVDGGYAVASEDAALKTIGCKREDIFEMKQGHFYIIDMDHDTERVEVEDVEIKVEKPAFCAFEFVYFADRNTTFRGRNVARIRNEMGRRLGKEHPLNVHMVVPIPESGRSVAIGYSHATGVLYEEGYSKNRGISDIRTFILQEQEARDEEVLNKLDPIREVLEGMDVAVADDSLVRGTTMRKLVKRTRDEGGANEVHVLMGCPPQVSPCYLGIDMRTRGEFAAARAARRLGYDIYKGFRDFDNMGLTKEELVNVIEEIKEEIGADGLYYLSFEGMSEIVGDGYCFGCWNPSLNPKDLRKDIISSIRDNPEGYRV